MTAGDHSGHAPTLSCRLSPQRCVPQDTGFSSLFLKVLVQMLQWLDGPAGEGGPLRAQLKLFAVQYSARHRIGDGEGRPRPAVGALGLLPLPQGQRGGGIASLILGCQLSGSVGPRGASVWTGLTVRKQGLWGAR